MTTKEKQLASYWLRQAADTYGNHVCNDVEESLWKDWTLEERKQFVKDFHDWNGDPEEYDPNFLHLPDYAIMSFLSHKLSKGEVRNEKINQVLNSKESQAIIDALESSDTIVRVITHSMHTNLIIVDDPNEGPIIKGQDLVIKDLERISEYIKDK